MMPECAVFILWDEANGLALMEDRPDLRPDRPEHYWVFPGGKVERGEAPVIAAVRECVEETGCRPLLLIELSRGEEWVSIPAPGTKSWTPGHVGWRMHAFLVPCWDGTPPERSLDRNHATLAWRDPVPTASEMDSYTCNALIAIALVSRHAPSAARMGRSS